MNRFRHSSDPAAAPPVPEKTFKQFFIILFLLSALTVGWEAELTNRLVSTCLVMVNTIVLLQTFHQHVSGSAVEEIFFFIFFL